MNLPPILDIFKSLLASSVFVRFWTSFGLNWLEFNLLELLFYNLSPISAQFGANYDKRIVAILYSKIINYSCQMLLLVKVLNFLVVIRTASLLCLNHCDCRTWLRVSQPPLNHDQVEEPLNLYYHQFKAT